MHLKGIGAEDGRWLYRADAFSGRSLEDSLTNSIVNSIGLLRK